jgi:hypothetical protein
MYKLIGGDQKEYGPVTADQLRQWFAEGRVDGNTLIRPEHGGTWKPFSSYPDFAGLFPIAPPSLRAPGAPPLPPQNLPLHPAQKVPTYLVPAILSTLCCCPPFGIVAIVYASQVEGKLKAGDLPGALESSKKAKIWSWLSAGSAIILSIIYGAAYLASLGSILNAGH